MRTEPVFLRRLELAVHGNSMVEEKTLALKRATVGDVVERLAGTHTPAYNTVLTTLGILERKGYVTHEKDGRAFAYLPVVDQSEARHSALSQVLNRFFDDSPRLLVLDLLGHERTDADELRRLRELIEHAPPDTGDATRKRSRRR